MPTEAEWEIVARDLPIQGNLRDSGFLQPIVAEQDTGLLILLWQIWISYNVYFNELKNPYQ